VLIHLHVLVVDFKLLLLVEGANEVHALRSSLNLQLFPLLTCFQLLLGLKAHLGELFSNSFLFPLKGFPHLLLTTL